MRLFALFLLVFSLFVSIAHAQSGAGVGSIEGVVQDQGAAVIPKAAVTVRNAGTGLERRIETDDGGHYLAPNLPPGDYEVVVEAPGFARLLRKGITLLVGQTATVNVTLQVSATTETVTVTGEAATVETDKTEVSSYVTEAEIENLPINGRRWDNFVLLTPAVVPDGNFGLISFRGISGLYNNNMIDGADNNQAFFSEARGRTRIAYSVSQSTIKEFQVGTSNYSAEFGRAAGGLVNAVTRSGNNDLHGEAFYFVRDAAMNAQNPFIKARGFPHPDDRRQQFGGWLGGPLLRDRVFWLLSYDQQKRNFPAAVDFSNPTGFLSPPTGNITDAQRAAFGTAADFFRSLRGLQPRTGDQNIGLAKVDWQITPANLMTTTLNIMRWRSPNGVQTQPSHNNHETANGFDGVENDYVIWKLGSTLSPTLLNEARFQWGRDFEYQRNNAPGPNVFVSNGISFGMREFLPRLAYPNEKRWQWVDNVSWVRGSHQLKFGADINYVRDLMINLFQGGGSYSYSSALDFATDCPRPTGLAPISGCAPLSAPGTPGKHYQSFTQAFDLLGEQGRTEFATTDYAFYVQDNLRLGKNLTVNLGLRYEYQAMPQPPNGNPALPLTQVLNIDKNNLGPRIGFAWDPFGNNRTVIRAGYGIFYGRTQNSTVFNHFINNGVRIREFFLRPTDAASPVFPNVLAAPPSGPGSTPTINAMAADFVNSQIHQFEFTIERELAWNTSVELSYLGSRGLRLPYFRDINLFPPDATVTYTVDCSPAPNSPACRNAPPAVQVPIFRGPSTRRPIAGVGRMVLAESIVNSWYNGLVIKARRRAGRSLRFSASLTWSKAIDTGQTSNTFFGGNLPLNPFDLRNERAISNFDVPLRFVASGYWSPAVSAGEWARRLINGFVFSTTVTASAGRPIDAAVTGSPTASLLPGGSSLTTGPLGVGGDTRAPWLSRNPFRSEGLVNIDFRIARDFRLRERLRMELLAEAFNLFNTTHVTSQVSNAFRFSGLSIIAVPTYLDVSATGNTFYRERQLQLAARFRF